MMRVAPCIARTGLAVARGPGMQNVYECGHAVDAWLSDGHVFRVVLGLRSSPGRCPGHHNR